MTVQSRKGSRKMKNFQSHICKIADKRRHVTRLDCIIIICSCEDEKSKFNNFCFFWYSYLASRWCSNWFVNNFSDERFDAKMQNGMDEPLLAGQNFQGNVDNRTIGHFTSHNFRDCQCHSTRRRIKMSSERKI